MNDRSCTEYRPHDGQIFLQRVMGYGETNANIGATRSPMCCVGGKVAAESRAPSVERGVSRVENARRRA